MSLANKRLFNIGVALAMAFSLAASAIAATPTHRTTQTGLTTLRLGYMENNPKWVPTLDPAVVPDTSSSYMINLMYQGLVNLKMKNGNVVVYDQLASRHTISPDKKTYTFYIRPNARFSDGNPVMASDVVFSIRRALSKAVNSPVNYYDALITGYDNYTAGKSSSLGVKATGPRTVQIKVQKPAAYFLYALTYQTNFVLEKKVVQGTPVDSGGSYLTTTCKAAVGSGQFKPVCANDKANDVTSFYPAGSTPTLTLVPNPYYSGRHPKLKLVIPAIDSVQTGYSDFLSGRLDQTFDVPFSFRAKWTGKPGAFRYPGNGIEWLAPNLDALPFSNIHCRLALAHAIDQVTLTKKVLHGAYNTLYTVVPPHFLGYYDGAGTPRYSPTLARQELAKCPGGINVTYVYRTDSTDRKTAAAAIQAMAAAVGIHLKLRGLLRADWLKIVLQPLQKTHTALAYNDWFMDYPDPQDYCDILLHSGTSENDANWRNKRYDSLIEQANATFNTARRAQLYIQAQKLVLGQAAFIPQDNFVNFDLVNTKVHGMFGDYAVGVAWAINNDWANVTKSK